MFFINSDRPGFFLLAFVLLAFAAGFYKSANLPKPVFYKPPATSPQPDSKPLLAMGFAASKQQIQTHAASMIELKDGRIRAFWFAGSREGAKDVEIISATFDPDTGRWSGHKSVTDRLSSTKALNRYIKKVGNPVVARGSDGSLKLYYVTVSFGGWSCSSITVITSFDEGESWSSAKRLISSPFINISTLVKGSPFYYADGSLGLPVYHELLGKFAETIRLDVDDQVIDKRRISSGRHSIQPIVMVQSPTQAIAMMRYSGSQDPRRITISKTADAGASWSTVTKTDLANPNAAISGVAMADGGLLLAVNNSASGRHQLSLVFSKDDGKSWLTIIQLEKQPAGTLEKIDFVTIANKLAQTTAAGDEINPQDHADSAAKQMCNDKGCEFKFSYPYLIQHSSGDFHLLYTWNRSFIKHVRFSRSWLNQRLSR